MVDKSVMKAVNQRVKASVVHVSHSTTLTLFNTSNLTLFIVLFLKVKYADLVKAKHRKLLQDSIQPVGKMHRPNTRTVWDQQLQGSVHLRVGEWVEILHEYAPGVCSDGGVGCIVEVVFSAKMF